MTQRGSFFDSTAGDRIYDAATMARSLDAIVTDGVITGEGSQEAVTESTPAAMSVRVGLGMAFVRGFYHEVYSTVETLALAAANATNPRIDRIVIRRDLTNRQIILAVVQGTPAASPTAPALTQVAGGTWEHPLAQVLVPAAASSIVNANITDQRTYAQALLGNQFSTSQGHDHDGTDSKKVVYADLLSLPATFAPTAHTHASAGTGGTVAYSALTGIPTTFNPDAHGHAAASEEGQIAYANLSGIPATFAPTVHDHSAAGSGGNVPWTSVSGKPTTFAPTLHAAAHKTGGADVLKASEVGGFDRKAAGGTVGTQLFVGTSTPTGATEGDIWIKA